jgi:hypothetical protein
VFELQIKNIEKVERNESEIAQKPVGYFKQDLNARKRGSIGMESRIAQQFAPVCKKISLLDIRTISSVSKSKANSF